MEQHSLTLADDARASNPGGIQVSKWRWLFRYPAWPVGLVVGLVLTTWLGLRVHWTFWIVSGFLLLWIFFYWKRVQEHFLYGDTCLGLVVSSDPIRIAVLSDLSKGVGDYPVIKIIEEKPSGRWPMVQEGMILPTVALYVASMEDWPHWETFNPVPVAPVCKDPLDAQRLEDRFGEAERERLRKCVKLLPSKEPGLYKLDLPGADWASVRRVENDSDSE